MAEILIIDDSWLTRYSLTNMLKPSGYNITEAVNGKDGIEKIIKFKPDCILLDLLMPEIDGFGVLKALNEKNIKCPVIVISADIQETSREKCLQLGVFDFANKPPKDNELIRSVAKALEQNKET
ncbi:response regulator [Desulfococcaceae bacterium HSG9]|nr:response regulator [Desulfococcaceae bacterium HSG9]